MDVKKAVDVLKLNVPKTCKMIDGNYRGGFDDWESDMGQAIKEAVEALEEKASQKWIMVAERLPEKTGDYWVAVRHLDGSISTEKMFWSPEWPYEDAWREVVVAWQAYYYPEPFVPQN